MTSNDIQRQLKLVNASARIATIYAGCGQIEAATKELVGLAKNLYPKRESRRAM
jgi:hypothetical protein